MLSQRLTAVFDLTRPGSVADIGTDHGYLAAAYVRDGRFDRVIAADVASDPLRKAMEYARTLGVEDRIDFRLGNGLTVLSPGEVDTAVIAGLGGETASAILEDCPWANQGMELIFQPMSRPDVLRRTLWQRGFQITHESFVRENGRIFCVVKARGGQMEKPDRAQELVGVVSQRDPLYEEYRAWVIRFTRKALNSIQTGGGSPEKAEEMQELLALLEKIGG